MEKIIQDDAQLVQLRLEVENQLRTRVLEAIQVILEEELEAALGCPPETDGYRNGSQIQRNYLDGSYGVEGPSFCQQSCLIRRYPEPFSTIYRINPQGLLKLLKLDKHYHFCIISVGLQVDLLYRLRGIARFCQNYHWS
jgi:hypothetical protein